MHDSLDLDALREQRLEYLGSNFQERSAFSAKCTNEFVENVKQRFPELEMTTPGAIQAAANQKGSPWLKLIILCLTIFVLRVLSLPSLISMLLLILVYLLLFSSFVKQFFNQEGSNSNISQYRNGCLGFIGFLVLIFLITPLIESFLSSVFNVSESSVSFISIVIFVTLFFIGFWAYFRLFYILTLRGPLAESDYEGALRRLESASWMVADYPHVTSVHAALLNLAGQHEEAFTYTKDVLLNSPSHELSTKLLMLLNMVQSLFGLERYEEALPLLEILVKYSVGVYSLNYSVRFLVEYYNHQETYPERALQLSQFMLEFYRKPPITFLKSFTWEFDNAAHAVALARNGQIDEARHIIEEMLPTTRMVKPYSAEMNFWAGKIELTAQDKEAARTYFQRAIELDPNGAAGQKAQEALAEL